MRGRKSEAIPCRVLEEPSAVHCAERPLYPIKGQPSMPHQCHWYSRLDDAALADSGT